jgi:SsrA-binding protein
VSKGPGRTHKRAETTGNGPEIRVVARNRRARHDYDILETYECGLELRGSEVKSLRANKVAMGDAYARVDDGELWLFSLHISPYDQAVGFGAHDPDRRRKLLVHRAQIDELLGRTQQQSLTLVPLSIYFKEGRAKLELALAKGRKTWDKRHAIADRDANLDAARDTAYAMGRNIGRGSRREYD